MRGSTSAGLGAPTTVGHMTPWSGLASVMVGYLLGTTPSADIAGRTAGSGDLRQQGSGNPGAANVAAVLGTRAGVAVLVADIAKGAVAARLGLRLAGAAGAQVAATAAVAGHCYPVWTRFRGGKGVATSVGQVLATFPLYFPVDLAVAIVTVADRRWRRRAFAATSAASLTWVTCGLVWWRRRWPNLWGPPPTLAIPVGAAASSAVIASRFLTASSSSTKGEPVLVEVVSS